MELHQIWTKLTLELAQSESQKIQILEYRRGDKIYVSGDQPRGLFRVEKGLVGLVLIGRQSGQEHLMRFFREGQFFGHRSLFSDEPYHAQAVALESTTLKVFEKDSLKDFIRQKPELLWSVIQVLSIELRRSEDQHVMILENEIVPRVAQCLIFLKELHPHHNWTRQEIANFCGSTTSTVIKALSQIESLGLILQSGRTIEIRDRAGLLALQEQEA